MAYTHALSTNNYGVGKLIVSTSAANGTHTTLAGAMADAVSGDTIFLRDSVTENVTITPGVNISAWSGGSANTPSITGLLTMTAAGTSTISGLTLITNAAAIIAVTGSAASILNVNNCYLNALNFQGITYSSSSASSKINLNNCFGDLGSNTTFFASTGAGILEFINCNITNTGGATTASTASSGTVNIISTNFSSPITFSATAAYTILESSMNTAAQNATSLTVVGGNIINSFFQSGSASSISISSGTCTILNTVVSSSNTNAITGAGTIAYSDLVFASSSVMNVTTQTALYTNLGKYKASGQPAFSAYLAATVLNKTGQGESYTLGTDALTEIFDQDNNFNTNGTFTAPVTGRYQLTGFVVLTDCLASTAGTLSIVTTARTYIQNFSYPAVTNGYSCFTVLADMAATNTATVAVSVAGEATTRVDIFGAATVRTGFSGYLVC